MNWSKKIGIAMRKLARRPVLGALEEFYGRSGAASQIHLQMMYRFMASSGNTLPKITEVGFKVYSQSDEDGILLFIFSLIGTTNKKCVEICAGNGIESNTANLIINHGWKGLLVDGNPSLVDQGRYFYSKHQATYVSPPKFLQAWITRNNVNQVIRDAGFTGEIDLLSFDMDGMDYWIWQALDVIRPRVVILEYNNLLGSDRSVTVPYQDQFNAYNYPTTNGMANYFGASLPAMVKLSAQKGYRLVGWNRYAYNAFFVRNDLENPHLTERIAEEAIKDLGDDPIQKIRLASIEKLQWEEV